ncbi:transglutaminase family protein [Cereibacter sphaeroides]|uniref:transglutaminase-like domain-containing protein n=1 Tax=Cereibacter sphaeroides TaxID=1063 RepID=UPI001F330222|nr:transglutaminase family protein [Cereibacter sphaeroides]MCE6951440.1 transglutaminase family protein [Cereibacter sphaeroides]
MLIRFGYEISVNCAVETPMISLLEIRDERRSDLRAPEVITTTPQVPMVLYHDMFGNTCRRFVAPAGDLTISGDGIIADSGLPDPEDWDAQETPIAQLPDDALVYLLGSRYCETDRISQIAWDMFGGLAPGWGRVQAISDFVHGHIRFDYQNARSTRTAYEAWEEGTGVCRDFTHLGIAFCRALNIPARYVNGYLGDIGVPIGGPMDFSAWMEAFVGGRWHAFDPRNNQRRIGRIVVARGRDAADVPLLHSFGPHVLTGFTVRCDEVEEITA